MRFRRFLGIAVLAAGSGAFMASPGWAQQTVAAAPVAQPVAQPAAQPPNVSFEQPDAQRTHEQLSSILEHYPPSLANVFALDPSLLSNQAYLAPYPALANYLNAHPEIARDPAFYFGRNRDYPPDHASQVVEMWKDVLGGMAGLTGVAMAIGLLVWLIRTVIDYRRWNRLTKVQTEVHTKLLDRFTANDDLLSYIQSPAGSKFLESSPITLDAGSRTVSAPLGRILWSVQAGVVLAAAGLGLEVVSARFTDDAAQPLHALGVLGIALGVGFVVSAVISYLLSRRLGLLEPAATGLRPEQPGV